MKKAVSRAPRGAGEQVQIVASEHDRVEILESWRRDYPDLARALELAAEASAITDFYNESQRPAVSYWFGSDNRSSA